MPVLNDREHSLDLDTLVAIHGLVPGVDQAIVNWAVEGIALDLDMTVADTLELLVSEGYLPE